MLQILIPSDELYDTEKEEFIQIKEQKLLLEHSLISVSKWESKWQKPFISNERKTTEETIDYIRCMTITPNVSSDVYLCITGDIMDEVTEYIENPMTATWFSKEMNRRSGINRRVVTSELIYYWMIVCGIPFECQKWNLNRLITLIKICNIENDPKKKRLSKQQILEQNRRLNEERKRLLNTKG